MTVTGKGKQYSRSRGTKIITLIVADTSSFARGTLKIIYNSGRLIVTVNSFEDTEGGGVGGVRL